MCSSGHILSILLKMEFQPLTQMEHMTMHEDTGCLMFLCHVRKSQERWLASRKIQDKMMYTCRYHVYSFGMICHIQKGFRSDLVSLLKTTSLEAILFHLISFYLASYL